MTEGITVMNMSFDGYDIVFRHSVDQEYKDISEEEYREYHYYDEKNKKEPIIVRIDQPLALNVSNSGGHRIFDSKGISHYIPWGWKHLVWKASSDRDAHIRF